METDNFENKENVNKRRPIAALILLSLLFGIIGGILGTWYVFSSPRFAKLLSSETNPTLIQKGVYQEQSAIIDVVKKASPSVVSIIVKKDISRLPGLGMSPLDNFFLPFGLIPQGPGQGNQPNIQQVGAGSGFFITSDGLIITNRHVVSDESATYSVVTNDGKTYDAKILVRDPVNDLAIVKVDIKDAPALELVDSTDYQIGQQVVAIGNSLGQYQNTVTSGIVSGIGRSITAGGIEGSEQLEGVIQTDAAINPGNSGGPLLNLAGQVIGINTAIDQQGQLVGFAIPAADAAKAVESFNKTGKIQRPYLGVRFVILNPALASENSLPKDYGALIVRGNTVTDFAVLPGSPADKAGLKENDIILEVNGNRIDENNSLSKQLRQFSVGDTIELTVFSNGSEKRVKVTLAER